MLNNWFKMYERVYLYNMHSWPPPDTAEDLQSGYVSCVCVDYPLYDSLCLDGDSLRGVGDDDSTYDSNLVPNRCFVHLATICKLAIINNFLISL